MQHQSFAVGVQQPQLAKRCGDLVGDDDLVDGLGEGDLSAAQIERGVRPVADDALVVAEAALPPDRRSWLGPEHDHPARAAAVGRAAPARQRALPRSSCVTGSGRPNDVAQLLGQLACRAWRVRG
jgi:hypothetical protein